MTVGSTFGTGFELGKQFVEVSGDVWSPWEKLGYDFIDNVGVQVLFERVVKGTCNELCVKRIDCGTNSNSHSQCP